MKKLWFWLIAAAFIAISVGAAWVFLWCSGAFLPRWVQWENNTAQDASGEYGLTTAQKAVSVTYQGSVLWNSPRSVKVQKALFCDMDNDRQDELVLLCWKIGRYGRLRPIWVETDEQKWSQHIFVYECTPDAVKPKWMSSYIGQELSDIVSNKKEPPYIRLWLTDLEGNMSSWVWNSWGFTMEDTDISFIAFGDILAHEPIYRYGLQNGEGFDFLFENMQEVLADSDIAIINQETPLTDNPSMYSDYPRFGTPVEVGQAIVDAGFDVVTCATNHALDRGAKGVEFTKRFFDSSQVICLGIQTLEDTDERPYEIITRKGVRFALLNYTYGTNGMLIPDGNPQMVHLLENEEKIRDDIARAEEDADCVLVFVHWGTEYAKETDDFQQKWTRLFLESGVDVVVGTHPHVQQPVALLTGEDGHQMLVYYSLGNYISAQPEKSCSKGGMAQFTVSLTPEGWRVTEYDLRPLTITWQKGGKYVVGF